MMRRTTLMFAGFAACFLVCCRQEKEIRVYRVAKDPQQAAADPHAGLPGMMPGGVIGGSGSGADPHAGLTAEQLAAAGGSVPAGPAFTDAQPAHWKKLPASAFLLAKYRIEGADGTTVDVTFSTLRSAPGGLLANINRWRGQMGQKPFAGEAELRDGTRTVVSGFGEAVFVEVEGLAAGADPKGDGRLIGAVAESGPSAWFFKMRGNAELAAAEREHFIRWMESVKPVETSKVPMHGTPPGSGNEAPSGKPAAQEESGPVTWTLPSGWSRVAGGTSRYATLSIPGAGTAAGEIAITRFPGDVGGDLANINRWRGQIGLDPVDEAWLGTGIQQVTAGPKVIKVVDFAGPSGRCAAGWVAHGGETWFFKFTGPDAAVSAEKDRFIGFLASVRFTGSE